MNKTISAKIFKIITKIKECRAKVIPNYEELVSIDFSFGSHSTNASREYIELFLGKGINSKCTFTFKTMEELEKFLNENIEGYGVSTRTKSKVKARI